MNEEEKKIADKIKIAEKQLKEATSVPVSIRQVAWEILPVVIWQKYRLARLVVATKSVQKNVIVYDVGSYVILTSVLNSQKFAILKVAFSSSVRRKKTNWISSQWKCVRTLLC